MCFLPDETEKGHRELLGVMEKFHMIGMYTLVKLKLYIYNRCVLLMLYLSMVHFKTILKEERKTPCAAIKICSFESLEYSVIKYV